MEVSRLNRALSNAEPEASASLSEICEGSQSTTIVREGTISRASHRLDICDDSFGTVALVKYERIRKAVEVAAKSRGINVRFITEITPQNLSECNELAKFVELRHVDGIKGNFAVTDTEYYSFAPLTRTELPEEAIHSSQPALVEHGQYIFQTLWRRAVPYEQKVRDIEDGVPTGRIEVSRDAGEIRRFFTELVESAKDEILFFFPTVEAFQREEAIGVIDALDADVQRGVNVRILSPINDSIRSRINAMVAPKTRSGKVDHRAIESPATKNTVTILVVDRKISFIIEQRDNSEADFAKAVGLATYSTSKPSVSSSTLFFEALWRETQLRKNEAMAREEESRARRQSELLQDILTHDIRNYNQVIKLSSELLEEEFGANEKARDIIQNMLEAVNGSTQLLERAKKLGKILSELKAYLYPVVLKDAVRSSLTTVQNAYPQKQIEFTFESRVSSGSSDKIQVVADDLLDEVFANAFSNSVKYTENTRVRIGVVVELIEGESGAGPGKVRISISDEGRGISDEMKPSVFSRYLKSARGTGLGMSIIHALVVERYRGSVAVKNRVQDDYSKGTTLEITLRNGASETSR
jgi:two-component system, OmpR family, sensor histidine kinase VicK